MDDITVTPEMVLEAKEIINKFINRTQLEYSRTFTEIIGTPIFLKPENLQRTGSYKIRGAINKMFNLSNEDKKRGVVTASAGNHAQGLALAASQFGIKSTVFMPKNAPIAKIEATSGYGANVKIKGKNFDETTKAAKEWQVKHNSIFVSPFDDDYIIAGQGTVGLEILEDCSDVSNIIAPVGGGGLISGIALAIKSQKKNVKVYGVQAQGSPALVNSFHKGKLEHEKFSNTIADGINIKEPSNRTYNIIRKYVDDMFTVDDEEISEAMLYLIERCKLVVEPSGAVALAALLNKKIIPQGKTVVILSGGNVDINMIDKILRRGLVKTGRYLKFVTSISDSPGALYTLLGIIYELNASIINIQHDRLRSNLKLGQTEVEVTIEAKNKEHNEKIINKLEKNGYSVKTI